MARAKCSIASRPKGAQRSCRAGFMADAGFGGAVRRRCQPNGDTSSAAARAPPAAGNGSLLEG